MEIYKKAVAGLAIVAVLAACGGPTSDDPATTTTARAGESIGVADAIDRAREVADLAEERANLIDELAP